MNASLGKEAAAKAAVELVIDLLSLPRDPASALVLGIGSGSTVEIFVPFLCDRLYGLADNVPKIVGIPTSFQAQQLILATQGLILLGTLHQYPKLDLLVDGADEIETTRLSMIKGGGAAHTQEKIVAQSSLHNIYIVDKTKVSLKLGEKGVSIPIEVLPAGLALLIGSLRSRYPQSAATLRLAKDGKVGPIITDNGNFVVDFVCRSVWDDLQSFEAYVKLIAGVVETGLFFNLANQVIIGQEDGSYSTLQKAIASSNREADN